MAENDVDKTNGALLAQTFFALNPNPNRFLIDFLTPSGTCSDAHRTRIHRTCSPLSFPYHLELTANEPIQVNILAIRSHVVTRANTSFPLDCVRAIKTSIVPLRGDFIFRNLTSSTLGGSNSRCSVLT